MPLYSEESITNDHLFDIAGKMMIAARTAPKGRGKNNLVLSVVTGNEIVEIADMMKVISQRENTPTFTRDAENILKAGAVLLMGTKINPLKLLYCGLCGFKNCDEKNNYPNIPCTFNLTDLGIAAGSALSIAADNRADNRLMYSVGIAVKELKLFEEDVKIIWGIPIASASKNPFFDRNG